MVGEKYFWVMFELYLYIVFLYYVYEKDEDVINWEFNFIIRCKSLWCDLGFELESFLLFLFILVYNF